MKLDKTTETLLIFLTAFVVLFTALFVNKVCADNNESSEYTVNLSLTGAKLSDGVYATVSKSGEGNTKNRYYAQYYDLCLFGLRLLFFLTHIEKPSLCVKIYV